MSDELPPVAAPGVGDRGVIHSRRLFDVAELRRLPATPPLDETIETYWSVQWDLRGRDPFRSVVVTHPAVNVSFTLGSGTPGADAHGSAAEVYGVQSATSAHLLRGVGEVFGVKFLPGGFAGLLDRPVATLTDRVVPLRSVLGEGADVLADAVFAEPSAEGRRTLVEAFLGPRLPPLDEGARLVRETVRLIRTDPDVTRVEHAAMRAGVSPRTLQRLFRRYVGVGPKWVIARNRLHDLADRLAADPDTDLARLAVELGWYDQAHVTREFSQLIGVPPATYARACAEAGDRDAVSAVVTAT